METPRPDRLEEEDVMIPARRAQLSFADGLIAEQVHDLGGTLDAACRRGAQR
jgi:hypothetical protein